MRRAIRIVLIAAFVAAPLGFGGVTDAAEATCRPEKPSTCEPYCPGGTRPVGPLRVCVPVDISELVELDCTCPPL